MLPLVALVLSMLTLDFSVLSVAAAVGSAEGSSAFLEKSSKNNLGESFTFSAEEEDWGLRRLDAFDYGELEEESGDAADGESEGGLQGRRLAAFEAGVAPELGQQEVAVEQQAKQNLEDVEELEHRRVFRTMQKLPGIKGIKTFLVAAVVMFLGAWLSNRALRIDDRNEDEDDALAAKVFSIIGVSVMGVGLLISLIALYRLGMSGSRRRKWVKQAQQAILDYQKELKDAEGKVDGEKS
ncbi:hypothetical protein Emag_000804 [Eimeria magna]